MMIYLNTIFCVVLYFVSAIVQVPSNHSHLQSKIANPPISKISYSSSGGRAGNYESLDISQDSLSYVQGHRGVEKTINKKTVRSFWDRLTKTIELKDFDKVRSDPGHALYDGIDVTISIEKGREKHSIVNGNEDSVNYRKIKPFIDLLDQKLAELRKKIIW